MRYVEWMLVFLSAWRDADSKQLASFYHIHGLKILHRKWIKQFIMCVAVPTSMEKDKEVSLTEDDVKPYQH